MADLRIIVCRGRIEYSFEAGLAVGNEATSVNVEAALLHDELPVADIDEIVKIRPPVLLSSARACCCSCTNDNETVVGRYDLDVFDMGDVKVAAEYEIDADIDGNVKRSPRIPRHVMGPERLNLAEVMVNHQHLERGVGSAREELRDAVVLALSNATSRDRPSMCRVYSEDAYAVSYHVRRKIVADELAIAPERVAESPKRKPPRVDVMITGHDQDLTSDAGQHFRRIPKLVRARPLGQVARYTRQVDIRPIDLVDQCVYNLRVANFSEVNVGNVCDAKRHVYLLARDT